MLGDVTSSGHYSCYKADVSGTTAPFIFGLDHGSSKFQHAVLLIQKLDASGDSNPSDAVLDAGYASSWKVYVGDDATYSNNAECDGVTYLSDTRDDYGPLLYPITRAGYGFEAWCNKKGRYTFYEASTVPTDSVTICAIGVFGTTYVRSTPVATTFSVEEGKTVSFDVEHVAASTTIGNTLSIELRVSYESEVQSYSVSQVSDSTKTTVTIDTEYLWEDTYTLILESFDANSSYPQAALATDTITIIVTAEGADDGADDGVDDGEDDWVDDGEDDWADDGEDGGAPDVSLVITDPEGFWISFDP